MLKSVTIKDEKSNWMEIELEETGRLDITIDGNTVSTTVSELMYTLAILSSSSGIKIMIYELKKHISRARPK